MSTVDAHVENVYATRRQADVSFRELLGELPGSLTDDELAEVIESDGRMRLRSKLSVTLERYLEAIPNLADRTDCLDAAIDVSLRARAGTSRFLPNVVEVFCADYPEIEGAIRETALINNSVWSTNELRERITRSSERRLPCDFGPDLPDGGRRYQLKKLLGTGASGEVYLAIDRGLSDDTHQALVAIKIFPDASGDFVRRARRLDEATKARRIDHPNVVRVIDRGTTADDEDYLVYEYVDGGDLQEWIKAKGLPIDPRVAADLVSKIARGVQAAHNAGLVHCDLKPGNILMTSNDSPRITDFGVASRVDQLDDEDSDSPLGNLAFMSPEQFNMEEGALSPPSDVYALGGILFFLISGELINGRTIESVRMSLESPDRRNVIGEFLSARRRSSAWTSLGRICQRACAHSSSDRYASADAFSRDLQAWCDNEPIQWQHPPLWFRISLVIKRRPLFATLVGMLAFASILVVSFGLWGTIREIQNRRVQDSAASAFNRITEQVLRHGRARTDTLPYLWMRMHLSGVSEIATPVTPYEERMLIMGAAERVADELVAQGRGDELLAIEFRTAGVYWRVANSQVDSALRQTLLDLRESWNKRLVAGDEFLDDLVALTACLDLQLLWKQRRDAKQLGALERAELERVVADLGTHESRLAAGVNRSTPLHLLVLENLELAFGSDLLDDKRGFDLVRAHYDAIIRDRPIPRADLGAFLLYEKKYSKIQLDLRDGTTDRSGDSD